MSARHQHLWLAVRLPDLPLTALEIPSNQTDPLVVIEKQKVVLANPSAQKNGVTIGMDVTSAKLLSGCRTLARNTTLEQQSLQQLCTQLYQFTPHIETYTSRTWVQTGLLLEIASCLSLFGGLSALHTRIIDFLATTAHPFSCGLAHSSKGAWLLSFAQYPITGDETPATFLQRLNQLPIQLLSDYPQALDALSKTGFTTLGDIAAQISAKSVSSFTKRFGKEFAETLRDIFVIDHNFHQTALFAKPPATFQPAEFFSAKIQFDYPISLVAQLHLAFENLLQQLCDYMRKRQWVCQYIEWRLTNIYRQDDIMAVHSDTPQSHWQLFYDLTLIQFNNKELPFEVDTLELSCHQTQPLQARSQTLNFTQTRQRRSTQDFAVTIAKLKARLGEQAVYKLSYRDSHIPEISNACITLAQKCQQQLPAIHLNALRPNWLLHTPKIIIQRHGQLYYQGNLTLLIGPERIIGEWWDTPCARDYFLAQRQDKVVLWIFLDLYNKEWYLQGVFA